MSLLTLAALAPLALAAEYDPLFADAAETYQVPEPLLKALAWEASRVDADVVSAWGGYGIFDLREDAETQGPGIEQVALLIGESPDDIMVEPALQIEGAAALLAWHAEHLGGGELPEVDALEDWAGAVAGFSGRHEPELQAMFVSYIYTVLAEGFAGPKAALIGQEVDIDAARDAVFEVPISPPNPTGNYYGNSQFVSAHSSNYSNYSRTASDINYIVIHTVQGTYSGCISWFQNSTANVSAHYVVRSSDGDVTQMVWEEDVAWHAGNWDYNYGSVGIEHEGYVSRPSEYYTSAMYSSSAELSADIIARNGISPDRSHVIAHSEVPGATHTDPGSGWDWSRYMSLIDGGSNPSGELLGVVADTDIYSGARLVGARVVLDQTGEATTTDGDGLYRFDGITAGTWSVTATYNGFEAGSCVKDVESSSGQAWCSVALMPADDPEPVDSDPEPVDSAEDSGVEDTPPDPPGALTGQSPGGRVLMSETNPGRCASGPATGGAPWLALLLLVARRRR